MVKRKKALLIAEKPSLAKEIQLVVDKYKDDIPYDIVIVSMVGHLLELVMPEDGNPALKKWTWDTLPFTIEDVGGRKYVPKKEERKGNLKTPEEILRDIIKLYKTGKFDIIINAADPDREGQCLFWEVYKYMGCRLPVYRFWTNDLTENHILNALKNLRDEQTDEMLINLTNEAFCRQLGDYITGLNMTRAATCKTGNRNLVAMGRVLSAMQKIVTDREKEIRNFSPVTVYGVQADYKKGFSGRLFSQKNIKSGEDSDDEDEKNGIVWFSNKEGAEKIINSLGDTALVTAYEKKPVITQPPKLFTLASAQIEAGKLGYKADKTRDIIQDLYEKKYVTYPRTECEYLSSDDDFAGILRAVEGISEYAPYVKRIEKKDIEKVRKSKKWVNDEKLKSSGHSALRPTVTAPNMKSLSYDQRVIYDMICRRFIAIFLPPLRQEETTIVTDISGYDFISKGKTLVDRGYTEIFETAVSEKSLPPVVLDEKLDVAEYEVTKKTSKCPSRFTSATLVAACENPQKYIIDKRLKGITKKLRIGTPATRAGIINNLLRYGYAEEIKSKKATYIKATEKGEAVIDSFGDSMIFRVDMTAEWEEKLEKVGRGEIDPADFDREMQENTNAMVAQIKDMDIKRVLTEDGRDRELGTCPICGEHNIKISKKGGYYCPGISDKTCGFWVSNPKWGKAITEAQITQLIETGRTDVIKGFETVSEDSVTKKKKKNRFDAALVIKEGQIKPEFPQIKESSIKCPNCGKSMRKMSWGWGCSGYPACKQAVGKFGGKIPTETQLEALLKGKQVTMRGLVSQKKPGRTYDAVVKYEGNRIVPVEFL